MSFKKIFKYGLYGIIICFAAVITIFLLLIALGYSINGIGWEVGEKAVQKNDISLCHKIIVIFNPLGLSPSTAEQRLDCILTYARIAKDPSACELLMPSSYGLSCVGGATRFLPCFFSDKRTVVWSEGNLEKDRREFPFESCSAHASSSLGKSCCIAAQSRFLPTFTDCASLKLSDPLMLDQCEYEVAIKNLSPDTCSSINDLNLQSSCMVQVKTLNKYPELRENYLFINK